MSMIILGFVFLASLSSTLTSAQIQSTTSSPLSSSERTASSDGSSSEPRSVGIPAINTRRPALNATLSEEEPSEIPRRQILRPLPAESTDSRQESRGLGKPLLQQSIVGNSLQQQYSFGKPLQQQQQSKSDERSLSNVDLLALKVDESLMTGLSQWLAKYNIQLPPTLMSRIEQLELCPDNAKDGLAHYCTKMADGQYHDPWNPWCGYIECEQGFASRMVCMRGTWMGFGVPDSSQSGKLGQPMLITKDDICRRQLQQPIQNKACSALTDYNLCSMGNSMQQSRTI